MTTQTKKPTSIFPDYPRSSPVTDQSGNFTFQWDWAFNQIFQGLQSNFKNEGILFPSLTDSQISDIENLYTPYIGSPLPQTLPDISGQSAFDSTNRVPKVFIITYDGATPPNIVTATWKSYALI